MLASYMASIVSIKIKNIKSLYVYDPIAIKFAEDICVEIISVRTKNKY